jgi:hypothetical protein
MMTMQIVSIGAVSALKGLSQPRRLRKEHVLRLNRPVLKAACMALMQALHFLEQNQIGVELMQTRPQFMNARHAAQTKQVTQNTFVDVVGGNP